MSAIAHPVAHNALEVLQKQNLPRAVREREASDLSGKTVAFVNETIEPGFATEAEAQSVYQAVLAEGIGRLACTFERTRKPPKPAKPLMKDGKRWGEPVAMPDVRWKLVVSYWKIIPRARKAAPLSIEPHLQARAVRKKALDVALTPEEVRAMAHAPLMAYRPQKALDHGLFEVELPENPEIIIPDE
ncbi:MAG: hypothetical protein QM645_05410 [Asticcacaulis sp.]